MAFHVACPITCKRICFCKLGFPQKLQTEKAREAFFEDVLKLSKFLEDPWGFRVRERETVQVSVPKVAPPPVVVPPLVGDGGGGGVGGSVGGGGREGDEAMALSAQTKRVAMQKKAAVASIMAEDYARRFESGDLVAQDSSRDLAGEEPGQSNVNVMCRMCFHGEIEGSERARKMLSCKSCGKKYHRSCLKNWAQHRDLFHWSSWTCPSCRICEVCRRTGDPNKFMFCRRCDGAYHCYCQQPPHKNVSAGPYLCSKHTRCHSCGSKVPGNGLSVRWFLGYTCCDACGRLFVKGNYCPVCLKVYRDSESTPMVCCDVCQRWVHCQCDGISDEKYMQFQVDGNLQYKCATCRGECYQVKDLEDAVRELWRRRDEADRDLITSLRAAAGLPTQEEIFSISPYSDDEDGPIVIKSEYGRSLKFSFKGSVDKSPKKTKKSSSKKQIKKGYQTSLISKTESHQSFENFDDARSIGLTLGNDDNDMQSHKIERPDMFSSPVAGTISHTEGICSINQPGVLKHKFVDEVSISNEDRNPSAVHIKSSKRHGIDTGEDTGKNTSKSTTVKGTKLVIHLGVRNKNVTNSPRSDASSCQREQELTTSNGSEDTSQRRTSDKYMVDKHDSTAKFDDGKGDKVDHSSQLRSSKHREREGHMIKLGKFSSDISNLSTKRGRGDTGDGYESIPGESMRVVLGKRNSEGSPTTIGPTKDFPASRGAKVSLRKHPEVRPDLSSEGKDGSSQMPSVSQSLPKDSKPLLKLKFKNPYLENQSSWVPQGEEERNSVKGQRSKRKRPSPFMEKMTLKGDEGLSQVEQDNSMDEIMDASWILKTLGKDAIGKRVEVHQPSDSSWHKGMVVAVLEGKSVLSVDLDDGRSKTVELGKQGIRFVPQKQKRSRT